jgi:hypothetical protein
MLITVAAKGQITRICIFSTLNGLVVYKKATSEKTGFLLPHEKRLKVSASGHKASHSAIKCTVTKLGDRGTVPLLSEVACNLLTSVPAEVAGRLVA